MKKLFKSSKTKSDDRRQKELEDDFLRGRSSLSSPGSAAAATATATATGVASGSASVASSNGGGSTGGAGDGTGDGGGKRSSLTRGYKKDKHVAFGNGDVVEGGGGGKMRAASVDDSEKSCASSASSLERRHRHHKKEGDNTTHTTDDNGDGGGEEYIEKTHKSEKKSKHKSKSKSRSKRDGSSKVDKELLRQELLSKAHNSIDAAETADAASNNDGNEDNEDIEKAERRRRRLEKKEQQLEAAAAASAAASASNGGEDDRRIKRREQEEKDKKMKQSIKDQRDAARDLRAASSTAASAPAVAAAAATTTNNNNEAVGEFEQRRRDRSLQEEKDKKMKQTIKEQRDAARSMRASSATASTVSSATAASVSGGGYDDRRSRQREQEEKDKKMKQSIKEQRVAAKSMRAGAAASSSAVDDGVGQFERQRRLKQQEQEEKDRKMKESIKEQRDAARSMRASSSATASSIADDDRRSRQREQEEKDRKMKESIKKQREAAKSLRVSGSANTAAMRQMNINDDNEGKMPPQKPMFDDLNNYNIKKASCEDDDSSDDDPDQLKMPYEESLNDDERLLQQKQREYEEEYEEEYAQQNQQMDKKQNLIDLHMAQFLATSQVKRSFVGSDQFNSRILYDENEDDDHFESTLAPLSKFEEEERQLEKHKSLSKRSSDTTVRINAWHQKLALRKAIDLAERSPEMEWLSTFYRCDPRWQIMKFFDEVARDGGEAVMDENVAQSPLMNLFQKANVFTVWRPTSLEAIKNMMLGIATGKGLDIKGKSAKKGNISSYVPFIQIFEEQHKEHVRAYIKDGKTIRVFYQNEASRNEAHEMLLDVKDFMLFAAEDAMRVLSDEFSDEAEQELAMRHLMYDDTNLGVTVVDTYANAKPPCFGLDITERLFWESYVMMNDCSRPPRTEWDIGRKSELAFMDMNFKAIRHEPEPGEPRAVVYQMSKSSPMEPRMLLMAYEENNKVKPVVSDFDCFLLGSRGVKYNNPIPDEQIDLVKWSVENISEVLDEQAANPNDDAGWMETWFRVLKKAALKGYYPKTPKYGNGDPKSYEIIEVAVSRLQDTGCVRHGAECFNWFFPQEVDDVLLVISDTLPGNVKWKQVNPAQLQDLLCDKIDEGFTFPLNPKWVLCDPGWRRVYDKLLASRKPNVQDSLNCWLPHGTGLREQIDVISQKHPRGFGIRASCFGDIPDEERAEGTEAMDSLEAELNRYMVRQRAWRKLRLVLFWIRFVREKRADAQKAREGLLLEDEE